VSQCKHISYVPCGTQTVSVDLTFLFDCAVRQARVFKVGRHSWDQILRCYDHKPPFLSLLDKVDLEIILCDPLCGQLGNTNINQNWWVWYRVSTMKHLDFIVFSGSKGIKIWPNYWHISVTQHTKFFSWAADIFGWNDNSDTTVAVRQTKNVGGNFNSCCTQATLNENICLF
jgi:hypothetical protein